MEKVTKEMMNSVAESPKRFWELLREMRGKGRGKDIPGQMKENEEDELSSDEKEINAMWIRAYHRKKYKCASEKGQKWHESLKKFVKGKEEETRRKGKQQRNVQISTKAFSKAVGGMKKDGAPGNDLITARLLNETSTSFKGMVAERMEEWANAGMLPDQFRIEIVVPTFKHTCRYIPMYYRPVTLVQVGLKGMQTVLYDEVTEKYGKDLTEEYNFGSVRKRDRHMAIWLTNLVCIYEQKREKHKGMVVMLA